MRVLRLLWLGLMAGCATRVQLALPPAPAVELPTRAVSVSTPSRACRDLADRVAHQLGGSGFDVRPDARARLRVVACDRPGRATPAFEQRSVAAALLSVDGVVRAQLLGVGRHDALLGAPTRRPRPRRLARQLDTLVAVDLAEQLSPVALPVTRRMFTAPAVGSARSFHNLAVHAEREGRYQDALWWAERAHERRPNSSRARYVAQLSRLVARAGDPPPLLSSLLGPLPP